MEIIFRDSERILATYSGGKLYPAPGVDRELLSFELFKVLMQSMSPGQPQVTWGSRWVTVPGDLGGP